MTEETPANSHTSREVEVEETWAADTVAAVALPEECAMLGREASVIAATPASSATMAMEPEELPLLMQPSTISHPTATETSPCATHGREESVTEAACASSATDPQHLPVLLLLLAPDALRALATSSRPAPASAEIPASSVTRRVLLEANSSPSSPSPPPCAMLGSVASASVLSHVNLHTVMLFKLSA